MSDLLRLVLASSSICFDHERRWKQKSSCFGQQIIVLRRSTLTRLPFMAADRLVLGWVCRLFPSACDALAIVRSETVLRWHRAGFRSYWRWKSRCRSGHLDHGSDNRRPVPAACLRDLIGNPFGRRMRSHAKPQDLSPAVSHDQVRIAAGTKRLGVPTANPTRLTVAREWSHALVSEQGRTCTARGEGTRPRWAAYTINTFEFEFATRIPLWHGADRFSRGNGQREDALGLQSRGLLGGRRIIKKDINY